MQRRKRKSMDDCKPSADERWDTNLSMLKVDGNFKKVRLIDDPFAFGRHWVQVDASEVFVKGSKKRPKSYPRDCTNFDPETEAATFKGGCPACEKDINMQKSYLINVIDRDAQGGRGSPVFVWQMTPGVLSKVLKLKALNVHKVNGENKTYHVNHPKYGRDLQVSYDESKAGDARWDIQLSSHPDDFDCPLTDEEKKLKCFDFEDVYPDFEDEGLRSAYNQSTKDSMRRGGHFGKKEVESGGALGKSMGTPDDDDDDEDGPSVQTAAKPQAMKSQVDVGDDEDEDDAPPPPDLSNIKAKDSAPASSGGDNECPHEDEGDEYGFGKFPATKLCRKCPNKRACVAACE